jgi:uncharacterized protein (DUF3084 family)
VFLTEYVPIFYDDLIVRNLIGWRIISSQSQRTQLDLRTLSEQTRELCNEDSELLKRNNALHALKNFDITILKGLV